MLIPLSTHPNVGPLSVGSFGSKSSSSTFKLHTSSHGPMCNDLGTSGHRANADLHHITSYYEGINQKVDFYCADNKIADSE
jgi:hypothetical protein